MKKLLLTTIMAALVAIAGTAIADDATATPHMAMEAQMIGQDVIGLVPEGLRIDSHTRGVITDGLLVGATTTGIDYMLYRHDGVAVLDARWLVVEPDGAAVAMTLMGFMGEPMQGMLEMMLNPAFVPPDVDIPLHGVVWFQTMAPQYAFLNHTVFGCTGTANGAQGVVRATCRSLAP